MPDRGNWLLPIRFRKAMPAEVDAYEKAVLAAKKPKLKAGDYIVFKHSIHDTQAGKPYKVEYYKGDGELSFKDDEGDWCSIEDTGEYEIVSADEAKWLQIGREVGEFRKGDVVRVTDGGMCGREIGTIGIVAESEIDAEGFAPFVDVNGMLLYSVVEIVAPFESTLN